MYMVNFPFLLLLTSKIFFLYVCVKEQASHPFINWLITFHISPQSTFTQVNCFILKFQKLLMRTRFFPSMKGFVTLSFVYLFRVLSPSSSELLFSNSRSLSSRRCFLHVFQSSGKFKPYTSKVGMRPMCNVHVLKTRPTPISRVRDLLT